MESTRNSSFFADYLDLIKQFRMPALDASAALESRRKDVEALAAAHTTALSGLQALGQKQAEIVSAAITRLQSLVAQQNGAAGKPAPAAAAGEATQQASKAWQKALGDVRELAEAAYRVHTDSFAVISRRVAENVEELKALLHPAR